LRQGAQGAGQFALNVLLGAKLCMELLRWKGLPSELRFACHRCLGNSGSASGST